MMNLRPMKAADADKMFEWKNYRETRKFAIASHDEIKKEDHYRWLEVNMQYFQVITYLDEAIGAIRIQDNEISIWVDRKWRGKWVASNVLAGVATDGMTAKIVDGNIASMRAFIRAGFKPISYQDHYYIFQK